MFEPQAPQERMFEPAPHEPRAHEDFSEPMLELSFALDDFIRLRLTSGAFRRLRSRTRSSSRRRRRKRCRRRGRTAI